MKILKIEENSQLNASLFAVIDTALKGSGLQILQQVNYIINSFCEEIPQTDELSNLETL